MAVKLQIWLIVGMLIVLFGIFNMVRKKKLDLRYALGWMLMDVIIIILSAFPGLLNELALLLGIATPVNMLFFFGFVLAVVIIFSLSVSLSRMNEKQKKMAQEIAIMRRDMYDRCNQIEKDKAQ